MALMRNGDILMIKKISVIIFVIVFCAFELVSWQNKVNQRQQVDARFQELEENQQRHEMAIQIMASIVFNNADQFAVTLPNQRGISAEGAERLELLEQLPMLPAF